jgi:peptide/nickel transport system permease protein
MNGPVQSSEHRAQRAIREFWRRYRKSRSGLAGLGIVCGFILLALLAGGITSFSSLETKNGMPFEPPGAVHYFGTDDLGRDVFSGVVYGARVSLAVGFLAAVTSAMIGVLMGALAGYFGGWLDDLLMRIAEMFMVVPVFVLALLLVALFGPSIINVVVVISILSWPGTARLVRAEFLTLKHRDFVEAARSLSAGHLDIIFSEILPNALAPVIITASLQVASAILIEAGLSFLGFGDPNTVSWGLMLFWAQNFIRRAPWMAIFPGLAISLATLGFNLIGDALNDALNPRLKER